MRVNDKSCCRHLCYRTCRNLLELALLNRLELSDVITYFNPAAPQRFI
jgi:hypothetical protein